MAIVLNGPARQAWKAAGEEDVEPSFCMLEKKADYFLLWRYKDSSNAGRELLTFLSANEATACNTLFRKCDIYKPVSTLNPNNGNLLTMLSCARETGEDVGMLQ